MNIVFLCKRLYTNRDLISDRFGRLFHFPAQLSRLGHHVTVIALDYKRGRPQETCRLDGADFISIPFNAYCNPIQSIARIRRIITNDPPQAIIASGDTYIAWLAHALGAQRPLVFDLYDDYQYFSSARIPGMKRLLRHMVGKASHVTTASHSLAERYAAYSDSISVLENGYDPDLFTHHDRARARERLNIPPDATVIGYFGSLSTERGINTLLNTFSRLQQRRPKTILLLAGKADDRELLQVPGVDYRGLLPQQQIPALISACDVVAIPYHKTPMIDGTNACKISEYLACRVPVVATRVADMSSIFASTPESLAEPNDPESLLEAIERQLERPSTINPDLRLTWSALTARLDHILQELVLAHPVTALT